MKLIELYSLSSGLKIGKQYLTETFYPIPAEKYITIQSGSGMAAKNYPHYSEVSSIVLPVLSKLGISIVQLGGKDDPPITGCIHLQGQTTLHQSNYILSRAVCHLGNDSWMAHRAGEVGVPVVTVFGPTTPQNHGPYRFNPSSIFIESHRFGQKPSFASQESQPTIFVIKPEEVANAVFSALGLENRCDRKTVYIGPDYNTRTVELVPNVVVHPNVQMGGPLFIRMDYSFDEAALANNLALRRAVVMTNREIDLGLLARFKQQIVLIKVEIDKISPDWIRKASKLGIRIDFYSTEKDEEKLKGMRLDYYDACLFDRFQPSTREDFVKFSEAFLNKPLDLADNLSKLSFKTNKVVLSGGKVYLSKSHWMAGLPSESSEHNVGRVIDEPAFWEEISHGYFFVE